MVAYYFPPLGGIGSIRLASFARHLPEFGWDPIVLAPRDTPHAIDRGLAFPEESVVRARSLELSRVASSLPQARNAGPESKGGVRAFLRKGAHRYLYYPDAQAGWYPGAVLAGRRVLKEHRIDAVYSSSFPITAHLVARTLSRQAGIPWIAEFRDPWSDNLPPDHPHRRRAARLERSIADTATALVMPTPTWAAHFGARWEREIAVVSNGYDEGLESAFADWIAPDPPVLTHLGSYYPGRQDYRSLWEVLARLDRSGQSRGLRVRFVGEVGAALRAELAAAGIEHMVEVTGFVPHDEAMRLLAGSSMLFASAESGADPVVRGCIPAKLFEYLATGLPIMLLGDHAADAGALLADHTNCFVVEPTDADAVAAALELGLGAGRHSRSVENLTRRARTRTLAGVFTSTFDRAGAAPVGPAFGQC
jgi:glycosyltransferase involved in cell wall biosynthesis